MMMMIAMPYNIEVDDEFRNNEKITLLKAFISHEFEFEFKLYCQSLLFLFFHFIFFRLHL